MTAYVIVSCWGLKVLKGETKGRVTLLKWMNFQISSKGGWGGQNEGLGQRLFGPFPKIHLFWFLGPSLGFNVKEVSSYLLR